MRRNIIQELMSETVVYGGLVATRGEVYLDAIECGCSHHWADRFAFRDQAVQPEAVAHLPTLKQIREYERAR